MTNDPHSFLEEAARYETKAVAFYDVLGWRSKIEAAGDNVERITLLKNIIRVFSALADAYKEKNPFAVRLSSFSDNVVITTEASLHSIFTLILRLGFVQLYAAQLGFWTRGGVTIGKIVHDEHVVFGPALNRAYYLESKIADKPRIVIDPECFEPFGGVTGLGDMVALEDGVHYLDIWTINFANLFATIPTQSTGAKASHILAIVLGRVLNELNGPIDDKARQRMIWLRDKLVPVMAAQ
jgi:hypothetical protein